MVSVVRTKLLAESKTNPLIIESVNKEFIFLPVQRIDAKNYQ
ncbi:MAG: hypothetical protein OFPI_42950 [Osedax symbiont Rs2]|nr:MAG: hypothetical protein OFPI_42950 [Osedax symbiont Rs2]